MFAAQRHLGETVLTVSCRPDLMKTARCIHLRRAVSPLPLMGYANRSAHSYRCKQPLLSDFDEAQHLRATVGPELLTSYPVATFTVLEAGLCIPLGEVLSPFSLTPTGQGLSRWNSSRRME